MLMREMKVKQQRHLLEIHLLVNNMSDYLMNRIIVFKSGKIFPQFLLGFSQCNSCKYNIILRFLLYKHLLHHFFKLRQLTEQALICTICQLQWYKCF